MPSWGNLGKSWIVIKLFIFQHKLDNCEWTDDDIFCSVLLWYFKRNENRKIGFNARRRLHTVTATWSQSNWNMEWWALVPKDIFSGSEKIEPKDKQKIYFCKNRLKAIRSRTTWLWCLTAYFSLHNYIWLTFIAILHTVYSDLAV